MNIYKLENPEADYEHVAEVVVCAENEEEARRIIPSSCYILIDDEYYFLYDDGTKEKELPTNWCHFKDVIVIRLGIAKKGLKKGIL